MNRYLPFAAVVLLAFGSTTSGSITLSVLDDLPATYDVAGDTFEVKISLTEAIALVGFDVELQLLAPGGTAGIDFEISSVDFPGGRYVFRDTDATGALWDGSPLGSASVHIATSGFDPSFSGADTVADVNDLLATVTVATYSNVGDLQLVLTPFDLIDANFDPLGGEYDDESGLYVPTTLVIEDGLVKAQSGSGGVIPESSSLIVWVLLAASCMVFVYQRRLGCRQGA